MAQSLPISIIVAVYQAEGTIERCLDSLRAQTFGNFEVLLIDDGSTDGSGGICDRYAAMDTRFRAIHQPNAGVSATRQRGIDEARGEYTIHADPDDWVEPDMLEKLWNEAKRGDYDMVVCDFLENSYKGQTLVRQPISCEGNIQTIKDILLTSRIHGSLCNKLIRRACYTDYCVTFPKGISFCEDQLVVVSLLLHPIKTGYLPQAFYHYVRADEAESLSRKFTMGRLAQDEQIIKHYQRLLADTDMAEAATNRKTCQMVAAAFWGGEHVFTSQQFKATFAKHLPLIRQHEASPAVRLLLLLSCRGLYQPTIKAVKALLNVKRAWLKNTK